MGLSGIKGCVHQSKNFFDTIRRLSLSILLLLGACGSEPAPLLHPPNPPPVRLPTPEEAALLPDTLVLGSVIPYTADATCRRLNGPDQPFLVQEKWVAAAPQGGEWYPLLEACPIGTKRTIAPILRFQDYDIYVTQAVF